MKHRTTFLSAALALAGLASCSPKSSSEPAHRADRNAENASTPMNPKAPPASTTDIKDRVVKTDEEWRRELTPEQYRVLREKGTERAFTGKYWRTDAHGVYRCAACGEPLFTSDQKFDSGCGWPSFSKPIDGVKIEEHSDISLGMVRTEVTCRKCGGHLGHVFDDGPGPTGLRYCINSVSIDLDEKVGDAPESSAEGQNDRAAPDTH